MTVNTYSKKLTSGSQISYYCEAGLTLSYLQTVICQSDGSWFPDPSHLQCKNNTVSNTDQGNCSLPMSEIAYWVYSNINGSLTLTFNCSEGLITTVCTTEGIWEPDVARVEHECHGNWLPEPATDRIRVNNDLLRIIASTAAAATCVIILLLVIITLLIIKAVKIGQLKGKYLCYKFNNTN